MKVVSLIRNLLLVTALIFGIQATASAAQAVATVGPNTTAPNVFYAGGLAGNLNIFTNDAFIRSKIGFGFSPNVTIQFSQMVGVPASYVFDPATGVWYLWLTAPNGGPITFQVVNNINGSILLRGQFSRAILHGCTGSSSLAITLPQDNVTYSQASMALIEGMNLANGSFSIAILSQAPVIADPIAGPGAFNANGDTNFGTQ